MSNSKFKVGDKVRLQDGSKIADFTGGWISDFTKLIGRTFTIREVRDHYVDRVGYYFEETAGLFDERALVPVKGEKIVIYVDRDDPMKVIAKDIGSGATGVAKCSPSDVFDFYEGAVLAFDRLRSGLKKSPDTEKTGEFKFKVGDVVIGNEIADMRYTITKRGWVGVVTSVNEKDYRIDVKGLVCDMRFGHLYIDAFNLLSRDGFTGKVMCIKADNRWWKVGKIYDVYNGVTVDEDKDVRCYVKRDVKRGPNFYEFHGGAAEFALVEEAPK